MPPTLVRASDGVVVASSLSSDNSYEFLEFALAKDTDYTIKIKAFSWTATQTYFGIAWYVHDFGA